jgi:hypothetical protein
MNAMTLSTQLPATAPLRRRILGSFLSALVGWAALMGVILSHTHFHSPPGEWWDTPGFYAFYAAIAGTFIFGTWLVILIPLYLLVPLRSPLWHWLVCTICGVLSGALIMFVICRVSSPQAVDWPSYVVLAAIVGGVTCLFASLTRRRFQYDRNA